MNGEVVLEKMDNLEDRVDKVEGRLDRAENKIDSNSISIATLCAKMDLTISSINGLTKGIQWGIGLMATVTLGLLAIYFK